MVIAAVAAGIIGFFFFITMRLATPQMALLYSGLELGDSAKIVEKLESMSVPYKLVGDGSSIMVPEDQVLRLRITVAEGGLASSGSVGYEIFDRTDSLGTTSFVQNINHVRALEGELTRTIQSIEQVASARVHLVLPKRKLFSRDEREPSASIILRTKGGRLSPSQVRAVQNLVASAVPKLDPTRISIIDQNGTLLARGAAQGGAVALATSLEEKKVALENRLRAQVENLLEQTVGLGKVRAEVTAEMDLNRITTNSEIYDPDGQVIRSSQTVEEQNSNQENAEDQSISIATNLPDNDLGDETAIKNQSSGSRTQETVNYEISKTIKTQIHEAGTIKRLSVAVLVDGRYQDAGADSPQVYEPRSADELSQLEELVRSAIGYDEERGDTVKVVNLQFAEVPLQEMPVQELNVMGFNKTDIMRIAELLVLAIVAILVILLVLRPLIARLITVPERQPAPSAANEQAQLPPGEEAETKALSPPLPGGIQTITRDDGTLVAVDESGKELTAREVANQTGHVDAAIDIAAIEGKVKASAIKKVGELIGRHPDEATAVIRSWMYGS